MLLALIFSAMLQSNPTLVDWESAITAAQESGDMEASIGRLVGTEHRVSLCALDGSVTRMRCFHSTQRMVDGVEVVNHSQPAEYDGQPLADVLAAEQALVTGQVPPLPLR